MRVTRFILIFLCILFLFNLDFCEKFDSKIIKDQLTDVTKDTKIEPKKKKFSKKLWSKYLDQRTKTLENLDHMTELDLEKRHRRHR